MYNQSLQEVESHYQQCLNLWGMVIIQAIEDYRKGSRAEKLDAVKFFKSEYFIIICDIISMNPDLCKKLILRKKVNHKAFHADTKTALCFECGQRNMIKIMHKEDNNYICKKCKKERL